MRLTTAIMTVSERLTEARALQSRLNADLPDGVAPVQVSVDEDRQGCWFGCKQAWKLGGAAPHHLVLQDDVLPCADFLAAVAHITEMVHGPVTYFSRDTGIEEARTAGHHWCREKSVWGQAISMPVAIAHDMIDWVHAVEAGFETPRLKRIRDMKTWWNPKGGPSGWDDTRIADYFDEMRLPCLATAPSLVEHRVDELESVVGTAAAVFGQKRVARWFIGAEARALELDWTKGLTEVG